MNSSAFQRSKKVTKKSEQKKEIKDKENILVEQIKETKKQEEINELKELSRNLEITLEEVETSIALDNSIQSAMEEMQYDYVMKANKKDSFRSKK